MDERLKQLNQIKEWHYVWAIRILIDPYNRQPIRRWCLPRSLLRFFWRVCVWVRCPDFSYLIADYATIMRFVFIIVLDSSSLPLLFTHATTESVMTPMSAQTSNSYLKSCVTKVNTPALLLKHYSPLSLRSNSLINRQYDISDSSVVCLKFLRRSWKC